MKSVVFKAAFFILTSTLAFSTACSKQGPEDSGDGGFSELVPDKPDYMNVRIAYNGYDGDGADVWTLLLYTDMQLTDEGGLIEGTGPGQVLHLVLNAAVNPDGEPDLAFLAGEYVAPANSGDFSEGTWQQGMSGSVDSPWGPVEVPGGSWFADFADGQNDRSTDFLNEGSVAVELGDDGAVKIEGVMVGTDYLKRYFSWTGRPEVSEGDGGQVRFPNSSLTGDIEIPAFTKARLIDRKDIYTWDQRCRAYALYLAEEGVDISGEWPSGSGKVMRIELFAAWEADVADGIPEGTYEAVSINAGGGIPGEQIKPFGLVPGSPDKFQYFSGSWYIELEDGAWKDYARTADGTVEVARDGDAHRLDIRLKDCSDPAWNISGVWETDGPIAL